MRKIQPFVRTLATSLALVGICNLLSSCGSTATGTSGSRHGGEGTQQGAWKEVPGVTVTSQDGGSREVLKATVNGREVMAALSWRNYNAKLDGAVRKWYGDMASPPPKYVVESLTISIDGRGLVIPKSKVRYLASQWMNDSTSLGLNQRGSQLRLLVDVGDGAEGWTATYVIDPSTLTLVSHAVEDGPTVHNGITE